MDSDVHAGIMDNIKKDTTLMENLMAMDEPYPRTVTITKGNGKIFLSTAMGCMLRGMEQQKKDSGLMEIILRIMMNGNAD